MALGISHGSQAASLRFRAENAHRLPTSPTGWYLYHKSKNYNTGLGGVKEGLRMGGRIAFWTAGLLAIEDMCDRWRGKKDVVNTVVASLSVAGGFSLWSEFCVVLFIFIFVFGVAFGFGFWSCACVRGSCDFKMNQWIIAPKVFSDACVANSSLWMS